MANVIRRAGWSNSRRESVTESTTPGIIDLDTDTHTANGDFVEDNPSEDIAREIDITALDQPMGFDNTYASGDINYTTLSQSLNAVFEESSLIRQITEREMARRTPEDMYERENSSINQASRQAFNQAARDEENKKVAETQKIIDDLKKKDTDIFSGLEI